MIAGLFLATAAPAAWRAAHGHSNDFSHYWNAAMAMRTGNDIYVSGENRYVYPPLLAFLFQPFTLISDRAAAPTWIVLSGMMVVTAVLIVANETIRRFRMDVSQLLAIAAVAMILAFDKIRSLLSLGQSDAFTLLGFACALRWMERRPWLAGVAIGASANVKYLALIFVPYFLIKRFYRAAVSSIVFFGVFLLLPIVQIGFLHATDYATIAFAGLIKMFGLTVPHQGANVIDVAWNRSVSITSTVFRFTRSHGIADFAAALIVLLLFGATLGALIAIWRTHRAESSATREQPDTGPERVALEWAALIVLALVFSPQTTLRHMVLMVLAYVVAIGVLLTREEFAPKIFLGCAIALMAGALTLPPYGIGLNQAVWTWRAIGGASWCALVFLFVLTSVGLESVSTSSPDAQKL